MADIQFADFGKAIGDAESILEHRARRNYLAEDRAGKESAAPFISNALRGDPAALNEIATRHPDTAMKLAPLLERMQANERVKTKEIAEFTASGSNAVLQADPADRPAVYAQILADGKARGFDLSRLPPTYTPQVDSQLRTYRSMAIPVLKHFENEGGGVQFAPPAGGGGGGPAAAISGIESGGKYDAVGPAADAKGSRAYGKYQVMDFNVGPWTQEVLGKAMTPQEFLANPQAQDAVFNAKFGQYTQKHGSPAAAARAWFAGEGGMNNPNAKDVNGTTVAGYEKKFNAGMGSPSGAPPGMAVGADMPAADASGNPLPPAQQALAPLRGLQLPPGARVALQKGVPIVKDGAVLYIDAQGGWGAAPLPQRKDPAAPNAGPFAGTGMEQQATNILLTGDPSSPEYAAAYAHMSAPRTQVSPDGQMTTIQPPMGHFRPPTPRAGMPGVSPAGQPPAPGDPQQLPGGQTATQLPGRGKPIPGAENEKIAAGVTLITNIDKALETIKNPTPDNQPSGRVAGFVSRNLGQAGDQIAQEIDPAGVNFRAVISDVSSQIMLARSGAAVTEGEAKRLIGMLPSAADKPEVIAQKLGQVRSTYAEMLKNQAGQYTRENGFIPHEGAQKVLGGPSPSKATPEGADRARIISQAKDALLRGAQPEAVAKELQEKYGISPKEIR